MVSGSTHLEISASVRRDDAIMAESSTEDESVVAGAAAQNIVTSTTINFIVT